MSLCLHADAYRISPWVLTVWVALREKQLVFTLKDVALNDGEQRQEAYLSRSVLGKVPVLEHDELWLRTDLLALRRERPSTTLFYAAAQWARPSVREFLELPRPAAPPP